MSDSSSNSSENELSFKPTGTTNFLMTTFNIKTKDREILFDGAVPLHKFVYHLYDFFFAYIHQCPINSYYYLSAILKPETDCRPEVRTLSKLTGHAKKAQRVQEATPIIQSTIEKIYSIFATWISKENNNRVNKSYRSDTNVKELVKAYQDFHDNITKQLHTLIK